jgi:hypothetical protein
MSFVFFTVFPLRTSASSVVNRRFSWPQWAPVSTEKLAGTSNRE